MLAYFINAKWLIQSSLAKVISDRSGKHCLFHNVR
jgi:hypothetical protein